MRQMLITKFACATCGNLLNLTYEAPKNAGLDQWVHGEPTGALMVQHTYWIEPCKPCIEPAERMKQAVETLLKGGAA